MADLQNKKIAVLGLGVSGQSAARFLRKLGAKVICVDQDIAQAGPQALYQEGFELIAEQNWDANCELAVVSPGISLTHPLCQRLAKNGIELIGEIELAARELDQPCIGITGTNGKTTVTLLVAHILNCAGIQACALGNVGTPLTQALLEKKHERVIFVIELSSYQLESMSTACLDAGVILNITPDHLDRYNYSMEEYAKAKCRIQRLLRPNSPLFAFQSVIDEFGKQLRMDTCIAYGYSDSCAYCLTPRGIEYRGEIELAYPASLLRLAPHDYENFAAAYALCKKYGVSKEKFLLGLRSFKKPPHRIEFVSEVAGVKYYDDSKGTNVDAVIKAVESMPANVVLIAGGLDKGSPFKHWVSGFNGKVSHIFAIGQAAATIQEQLKGKLTVDICSSLEEAVLSASKKASPGECVLLSPGCASTDMFKNYAHRGEVFKQTVLQLQT